ncbi:MAG: hypothetical protein A2Y74_04030 [Actinobacteria bacterium RBG_13_63_9]|nr:MAG: hypothetical protein A2Y74_04030 [Actinobacteria bacterium RBG_13_63_9]
MEQADSPINKDTLAAITDARTFRRGRDYARLGRVGSILEHDGAIEAAVRGTRSYRAKLWHEQGKLRSSCTCPLGEDGIFCKHCVALGLVWMGEGPAEGSEESGVDPVPAIEMDEIRSHLLTRDKSDLADIILSQALDDERLLRRLFVDAARTKGHGREVAVLRNVIDNAVRMDGFVGYREASSYAQGIEDAVNGVEHLLKSGQPAAAVELAEYALKAVEGQMESVDDSDGSMRPILDRLQEIHHSACVKARLDRKDLARRLFAWELNSEWDVFAGAASTYGEVLGSEGLTVYRALAETEWSKVKPLLSRQDDASEFITRFRITHIMEMLARQTGDVEQLVAVKSRDLSIAYHFLEIAEEYKKAGKGDLAVQWAERGVRAFPEGTDSRLREFLANEYHGLKRHDEAMALMWTEFVESPRLGVYQQLKSHADRFNAWSEWRAKAFDHLRAVLATEKPAANKRSWAWEAQADSSTIVRILLWEKDDDAAWREAQKGGCTEDQWLELARGREKSHPQDALPIYQRRVDPELDKKNIEAYREVVRTLQVIRRLMKSLGREADFTAYLEEVRSAHRQKRNFMKLLDQVKWH